MPAKKHQGSRAEAPNAPVEAQLKLDGNLHAATVGWDVQSDLVKALLSAVRAFDKSAGAPGNFSMLAMEEGCAEFSIRANSGMHDAMAKVVASPNDRSTRHLMEFLEKHQVTATYREPGRPDIIMRSERVTAVPQPIAVIQAVQGTVWAMSGASNRIGLRLRNGLVVPCVASDHFVSESPEDTPAVSFVRQASRLSLEEVVVRGKAFLEPESRRMLHIEVDSVAALSAVERRPDLSVTLRRLRALAEPKSPARMLEESRG